MLCFIPKKKSNVVFALRKKLEGNKKYGKGYFSSHVLLNKKLKERKYTFFPHIHQKGRRR
jgi:hypothetical protein